jgi:5-methylcytosine-specific restriction endonuclease McrA
MAIDWRERFAQVLAQATAQAFVAADVRCEHALRELRQRFDSLGRIAYYRQCLSCGAGGSAVARASAVAESSGDPSRLPWFDNELVDTYQRRRTDAVDAVRNSKNETWWSVYGQYLRSPEWAERRVLVFHRAAGLCEGCRKAGPTQVHHLTYKNVGGEFLWELAAVCDECHEREHPHMREAGHAA